MSRIAYADESGITSGPCYTIGVVSIDSDHVDSFNSHFERLHKEHGVTGEVKWNKINNSHGMINFALNWFHDVLSSDSAKFYAMVVNKSQFRNWSAKSKEEAFYQTYTYLFRYLAETTQEINEIYIDDRKDSYDKRTEIVENIGNHMLSQLASNGRIDKVEKVSSKEIYGVQIADLFSGAINSSHSRYLDKNIQMNQGKQITIDKLSKIIDWDDLCYDTYPDDKFNIWHFPKEYRSVPMSKKPHFQNQIDYISFEDLC